MIPPANAASFSNQNAFPNQDPFAFLQGGGEMGQRISALDWSQTSLGPARHWPQSLRTSLSIMLTAKLPMGLWWGEDLVQFYNDAYRPCLGNEGKHPLALGQRGQDCWPEQWPQLAPLIHQVLSGGGAVWQEDVLIPICREGRTVDAYWTFSYSPVRDETGRVAGVLVLCQDTTRQVENLRLAGQRFQNFVRQDTVGMIVVTGEEMVVEVVNDAYARLIDRQYEELVNRPLFSVIPEAKPHFHPIFEKVRQSGEPLYLYEYPYFVLVDGERKKGFLDLVYQPYQEATGSVTGVMVLCHEVTEKVLARRKVEESEAKYRGLFEAMDQGFCIMEMIFDAGNDPVDYRFLEINPVFEQQTGLKDAVAKTARELVPDLEAHWFEIYGKVALTGEAIRFEEGSPAMGRWFEVYAFRLGDSGSRKVAVLFTDISQRKRAETQLQEREEHFRTFANNIQNLAWMATPEGWIYWYNQRWYAYTGTDMEEMQGWGWEKVHHPDHRDRVVGFVKQAWVKGETWELTFPLKGADGQYRWFLTRAYAVKDAKGQILRWIGTNTDIDEQKRAQAALAEREREAQVLAEELAAANEELRAANEEIQAANEELGVTNGQLTRTNSDLDNFVYTASHDLKAPILNIEGLLKALERQLNGTAPQPDTVGKIYEMLFSSVNRFKSTIEDLTQVARISKESTEDVAYIPVGEILQEVLLDLEPQLEESGAQLAVKLDGEAVQFSRKNLKSILYNLLSNAVKYRSPNRRLRVRINAQVQDDYLVLMVEDNGLGMDMRQEEKIFALFKRLHNHVEGTGIGLYIVKKMLENAGGRIKVESQVGVGSAFKVYFKR
ncbi:MAG: PAS domain-containing protein [Cytophagales bacterium]|nr:PAS domain-containing protein [Cytophagales bacterium]